jgi:hypothetical protein
VKMPKVLQVLLGLLGLDICDACTWRLGKHLNFWGDMRLCEQCTTDLSEQYADMMRKEIARGG